MNRRDRAAHIREQFREQVRAGLTEFGSANLGPVVFVPPARELADKMGITPSRLYQGMLYEDLAAHITGLTVVHAGGVVLGQPDSSTNVTDALSLKDNPEAHIAAILDRMSPEHRAQTLGNLSVRYASSPDS